MLIYYYVEPKNRLYVHDYDSGFFKAFDNVNKKWVTPFYSFMQIEHDNDTDFVKITEEAAMKISNGITVDEEYKAFLSVIDRIQTLPYPSK